MIEKILVSLDISDLESAAKLLGSAEQLAGLHKAELHAVTVVPTYSMPIVGSYFEPQEEAKVLEKAKTTLLDFLSESASKERSIHGHIAHGVIYDEIVKIADKLGCQLIVIGAHRPELSDYLLGPNAARVLRHARQSVYVVRD